MTQPKQAVGERQYQVDLPEVCIGHWKIEKFEVPEHSVEGLRCALAGRPIDPGKYTRLMRGDFLIMSDTPAEIQDCLPIIHRAKGRVLLNGLGLGMVLNACLMKSEVISVDVVEIDANLIKLMRPFYRDKRVKFHLGDALTFKFSKGTTWDVIWHDIWDDICSDNLKEMRLLHRRYGKHCIWQGSWCRTECERRMI